MALTENLPAVRKSSTLATFAEQPDRTRLLIEAWLLEFKPTTRRAYRADLGQLSAFLAKNGMPDLLDVGRRHAAAWSETMRLTLDEDGVRVVSDTTIARRLSSASSFLSYAVEVEAIGANPLAKMKRPKVAADSDGAVWLDTAGMKKFLTAAEQDGARTYTLMAVMLSTGARISEVLSADVADLGYTGAHRVLTVTRKGGKRQNLVIVPWVGAALDNWLAGRTVGPLFATNARGGGLGRLDQPAVHRLVRKLAALAGLKNAESLHPHSLRHSAITAALENGSGLREVQAMAGHADPRTTERYDRMSGSLDASPIHTLGAVLASR